MEILLYSEKKKKRNKMTVDKYIFWAQVGHIANNLDNLDAYKEAKWIENFSFKEKLNDDIQIIDNLLENRSRIKTNG